MATLIGTDGSTKSVSPPPRGRFSYREINPLVGGSGYQEIELPDGRSLYICDDGKPRGFARNEKATALLRGSMYAGDWIAGDALLCERHEATPEG